MSDNTSVPVPMYQLLVSVRNDGGYMHVMSSTAFSGECLNINLVPIARALGTCARDLKGGYFKGEIVIHTSFSRSQAVATVHFRGQCARVHCVLVELSSGYPGRINRPFLSFHRDALIGVPFRI